MRRFLALVVVLLGIGGEAAAVDTPTDVGTAYTSSNPRGQLSGLLVNLADNNTATTPAYNRLAIKDNDVDIGNPPTCTNAGVVGEVTLLDIDDTATDDWVICFGTTQAFDIPDTGSDIIANAQLLVGTGAGTGAYVDVTGDVTISSAGATTIGSDKITSGMLASTAIQPGDVGVDDMPDGTNAVTWTIDADKGGTEPQSGAGLVIAGGSGSVSFLYNDVTDRMSLSVPLEGDVTGNAGTADLAAAATAVVNNPDPCPANQYVSDISTLSDPATALTCSQIDVANATGTLGIGRLNANYGDFTCNGATCTVGAVSSTTSSTFTVNNPPTGSEPANGAGFKIEGGSGDVTMTYAATPNELQFAGATGGYRFDGPLLVTATDNNRGATFQGNSTGMSAPSATYANLYALTDGEFYKKDSAENASPRLMLNNDNIIGDITCDDPSSGTSVCTVGAAKLDLDNFVSSLTGSANFNTNDAELRIAATTTNPGAEGEVQWDSATNGLEGYSGGAVRTVAMTGLSQPVKFGTVEVNDGGGTYSSGVNAAVTLSDAMTVSGTQTALNMLHATSTITLDDDFNVLAVPPGYITLFNNTVTYTSPANETRNAPVGLVTGFADTPNLSLDATNAAQTWGNLYSYNSTPTVTRAAGANGVTLTTLRQYNAGSVGMVGANATVGTRTAFYVSNVAPTGTLTTQVGLDIEALSGASSAAVPNNIGIRNASTEVYTPTTQVIAAATDTFACSATFRKFTTVTGTTTMTSNPTISNGATGQICILENVDATGTDCVTFPDGTTGLQLGAARTLCPNDTLTVIYDGTDWIEVATANN